MDSCIKGGTTCPTTDTKGATCQLHRMSFLYTQRTTDLDRHWQVLYIRSCLWYQHTSRYCLFCRSRTFSTEIYGWVSLVPSFLSHGPLSFDPTHNNILTLYSLIVSMLLFLLMGKVDNPISHWQIMTDLDYIICRQTGSGKTYSMGTGLENSGDPENEGPPSFCIFPLKKHWLKIIHRHCTSLYLWALWKVGSTSARTRRIFLSSCSFLSGIVQWRIDRSVESIHCSEEKES